MKKISLSQANLPDLKKSFVPASESISWKEREEESKTMSKRFDDVEKKLNQHDGQIQNTYNIAVLGFIVLLITVAGLVITVVLDYKNSQDRQTETLNQLYNEKYELLKERMNYLEEKREKQPEEENK